MSKQGFSGLRQLPGISRWKFDLSHQELVGSSDDTHEVRIMYGAVWSVMMLENVDEGRHEIPSHGHPAANFGVVHAEVVALDKNIVLPSGWGKDAVLSFFLDDENPERQLSDVVKEPAEVGLLFFKIVDLA